MPDRTAEFVSEFTKHARRLYRSIRAVVPSDADAEEVFQEMSVTLWEKIDDFTPGTNFGAWATKVAYYKVLAYRQKQRSEQRLFSDAMVEAVAAQSERMADSQESRSKFLGECMESLDLPDRLLLRQRYRSGATMESVAKALGRSVKTAYRRLAQVHQLLLECMLQKMQAEAVRVRNEEKFTS